MLDEFYSFVDKNKDKYWIHWNMCDENYGFQAIIHRYRCLEAKLYKERNKNIQKSIIIDDSKIIDLAQLLIWRYGKNYIEHPRLSKLIEKNRINTK